MGKKGELAERCKRGHKNWSVQPNGIRRCIECRQYQPGRMKRGVAWGGKQNAQGSSMAHDTLTLGEFLKLRGYVK